MSWQATAWAKATRDHRSHGEKLILFILADYAHPETWIAWPSIATLSNDAEMSERNVKRCLHSLEDRQFIIRLQRGNQWRTSEYLLRGPGVDTNYVGDISSPSHERAMSNNESDISNAVSDLSGTSEGDKSSSVIRNEYPPIKPPEETKEPPQWWLILGRDKRWPTYDPDWATTVVDQYGPPIDLEAEAFKAVTWLGTTAKGLSRRPRGMKTFWLNWLGRVAKDNRPSPSKARANTVQDVRKAKARRHGTT